jgi:hypothetical protein
MPLLETKGAASAQGFGLTSAVAAANYIEDVFQTWLYTGTGAAQTITNGIDLSTKGGLVWMKGRSGATNHALYDTARGTTKDLVSNSTAAETTQSTGLTAFGTTGFTIGALAKLNTSSATYASWTFRKQPKFFDVVTYTGTSANRTIAHSLGSVPGCIIVKSTSDTQNWNVYHRSIPNTDYLELNNTTAKATSADRWNSTTATSTVFSLGNSPAVNDNGVTYVAYLFAHDAGGFGASGTDNVISCGSYTGVGSTQQDITLGYEPQWLMIKRTDTTNQWVIVDNMRGLFQTADNALCANNADAEAATVSMSGAMQPTATGFHLYNANSSVNASGGTYIYIAIRRGPMRTPTTGTSVYNALTRTGTGAVVNITGVGFPPDLVANKGRNNTGLDNLWTDRLRGATKYVSTNSTNAEGTNAQMVTALGQDGVSWGNDDGNFNTRTYVNWFFRRAPGFFDEICFSGTGANKTESHNLQKAPELWLVKSRSAATEWVIGSSLLGANEKIVMPSPNGRVTDTTVWNNTYPTASVLSLGTSSTTNASGATFVGYLMATAAGVSKVGTYTGNGSSQTIDCGFTGGARFVMIIRATASTAQDIYIWDSARGIVAGNDPRLSLNTSAAEVTTLDTVDADASGFIVNTDASNVNVNGAVYLYWSVA